MRAINVGVPPARRVLDVGCGNGWVLAEADLESECVRVGIDYSEAALETRDRNSGIRFVVGDGANMPFRDSSFDVVIGHVSMPYMRTAQALSEAYRVLAPGGSTFFTFHGFRYARERFADSVRRRDWKNCLFCMYMGCNALLNSVGLPQAAPFWNRRRFETVNTPSGVAKAARRAGFELVAVEYAPDRIFFGMTARKTNGEGPVLAAPAWSIYCPLANCVRGSKVPAASIES